MRAVEYNPEDRFRSAAEMRDALTAHLENLRYGRVTYGDPAAQRVSAPLVNPNPPVVVNNQTNVAAGVEMVFCGFCGGRIAADDRSDNLQASAKSNRNLFCKVRRLGRRCCPIV